MSNIVTELPSDRGETAGLVLSVGLVAAVIPALLGAGAWLAYKVGAIDWWTAYGKILIGDGGLSYALQAALVAILAAAAGLIVTLWAGTERFYSRAMLNLGISAVSLWALVLIRGG
jgi:hypothetical protein